MKKLTLFIALLISLSLFSQEVNYDKHQRYVTDLEDLLTVDEENQLNQILADYDTKTTCEISVLTASDYEDFGDIGNYAIQLGEKWGVGKKDIDNGVLIIISKANDENFVAVGYGLEGYLTDAFTKRTQMDFFGKPGDRPLFYEGKYFEALTLFVNACSEQIGDEYSTDENDTKKEEESGNVLWLWFLAIPWYWKALAVALYILLWIVSPELAMYLTFFLFTRGSDSDSGSSFGGGSFGGGGSRS